MDSDTLQDSTALITIKKVLTREYGVSVSDLLTKVQDAESKAANTTDVETTLPTVNVTKLDAMLSADGYDTTAANLSASRNEWLSRLIESQYSEYVANGKIEETSES